MDENLRTASLDLNFLVLIKKRVYFLMICFIEYNTLLDTNTYLDDLEILNNPLP